MLPSTCSKVSLRQRPIKNERLSLYLDYYPAIRNPRTMKMSRREYLGFYIFANPRNKYQREYNDSILMRAEIIRCRRQEAVINNEFGFLDREQPKADFLLYFEEKAKKHYDKWIIVYRHFERFVKGKCSFGDITIELCSKFREYLLTAKQLRHPKLTITRNSAAGYWSTFRALLKEAYKERLLKENLNDFIEDIEYEEVKKNFLTADEVKLLAATPCEKPILKAASLFSILTGLRISDILKLRWEDIRPDADGEMAMFIRIQKTQKESIHPLSPEMLALCGERDKGIVFKGFNRSMTQEPLKKWLKAAGITKEELCGYLHATVLSDTRIVTTTVTTNDPGLTMKIEKALIPAMFDFAEEQREIAEVRILQEPAEASLVTLDVRTFRACMVGVVSFVFATVLYLCLYYALDEGIHIPETFERRYGIPMLGTIHSKELKVLAGKLLSERSALLTADKGVSPQQVMAALAEMGIEIRVGRRLEELFKMPEKGEFLLVVKAGAHNGKLIEKTLDFLGKCGITIEAALLWEADEELIRAYELPEHVFLAWHGQRGRKDQEIQTENGNRV